MKHFWLSAEQQALMDTATSTASDFGYVGLFVCYGKASQKKLTGMVGSVIDMKRDYLRTFNVTKSAQVYFGAGGCRYAQALIRMTARQAMMFKLRYAGSNDAWMYPDSTGESWGNMLIAQQDGRKWHGFNTGFTNWSSRQCMGWFVEGDGFGPTIATVGESARGLPVSWARALVWNHVAEWHRAASPVRPEQLVGDEDNLRLMREAFGPDFDSLGQVWARQWYVAGHDATRRTYMGVLPIDPLEAVL